MKLLTTNEAADLLSVHPKTLKKLVAARQIPVVRINCRNWRFRRETLEAWIQRREK